MRRYIKTLFSLAIIPAPVLAQAAPEVIATNNSKPLSAAPAQLGAPTAAVTRVAYRAQKDDKATTAPTADGSFVPLPAPTQLNAGVPFSSSSVPAPVPVTTGGPMASFVPPPFDPTHAPLPGGFFQPATNIQNSCFFISADYLYWWIKDGNLPPLVTTGTPANTATTATNPFATSGVLGTDPNAQILYGNGDINSQGRSGFAINGGWWFGPCRPWAIEAGFFFLGSRETNYNISSDEVGVLSRPFISANLGVETVDNFANPGFLAGSIAIDSSNALYGANIDFRRKLWCGCKCRVDGQLGFRYLHFNEDLNILEQSVVTNTYQTLNLQNPLGTVTTIPAGLGLSITDNFKVENNFYGGMFGLVAEKDCGCWTFSLSGRVSVGTTYQRLTVNGSETVIYPDGRQFLFPGGLLARPSNIGTFTNNEFSVVPELGFNIGYQCTRHIRLTAGYSALYWNNVLRVGDQIDRTVNQNGLPYFPQPGQQLTLPGTPFNGTTLAAGENRPAVLFQDTGFWAQGVNLGLLFTW